VFKGEMSLIGPRPTFMRHVEEYTEYELQRLKMKPGMTGLAQVNGGTCLPWKTRIEYDIDYINNYNLLLDFKILLKTLTVIFKGEESQLKEGKKEGIKKNV